LLIVSAPASVAVAQIYDRGEISGTTADQSGAVVEGVTVTIHEVTSGTARTAETDANGRYVAPLLPSGVYVVQAAHPGFLTAASEPVRLSVGQSLRVDLTLALRGVATSVVVNAAQATTEGSPATIFGGAVLTNLALNGRDYRDIAHLAPSAERITGTRGTFRLMGQPGDYLALHVDGADFTNNLFGEFSGSIEARNLTIPFEAVREFAVRAGDLSAEIGRSNGGFVNVVTKSGANVLRGSAAYFGRSDVLTAADAFGNPPSGLTRHQAGMGVGGPIVRNRAFFFLAAEGVRQRTPAVVKFSRDVRDIGVPELGIASLDSLEGRLMRKEDVAAAFGRVDQQLNVHHHFSHRLTYSRSATANSGGSGGVISRSVSNLESSLNEALSTSHTLSSDAGRGRFLETKFHFGREVRPRRPQGSGPQVQIGGTGVFGASSVLPALQDMYRYQWAETLHVARGAHTFTAGADLNAYNVRRSSFAVSRFGSYVFPTLEAFVARAPTMYSQFVGLDRSADAASWIDSLWQTEVAAYVQQRWRLPHLTIDAGLRYDAQYNPVPRFPTAGVQVPIGKPTRSPDGIELEFAPVPQGIPDDANNFGPRLGISYDPTGSGATTIRVAAGVYYGRTPMIYFPLRGSGVAAAVIAAPPAQLGLTFPQTLPTSVPLSSPLGALVARPSIQYVDPGFQNPRVAQLTASVGRLVRDFVLHAAYLASDSTNLRIGGFRSTTWDRNLPAPVEFDQFGRGIAVAARGRPDETIDQANALASFGRGRYRALVLSVNKRSDTRWGVYASYTLSKSLGNGSTERDTEALLGPSDPFDLDADFGINELDVRHSLKAFFHATLPHSIGVASTWTASSGLAFPAYAASDVNGDRVVNGGLNPDRPVVDGRLLPRFPFHQPKTFVWDLRLSKSVATVGPASWLVVVDVFNVLGTKNLYSDPRTNAIVGQPNFRALNRTLGPRTAQIGVRVEF
jgi:hypothetical protein